MGVFGIWSVNNMKQYKCHGLLRLNFSVLVVAKKTDYPVVCVCVCLCVRGQMKHDVTQNEKFST